MCWYLQPRSHFTSSQQRRHYEKQGDKRLLSRLMCTCILAPTVLMVGEDEGMFNHEDADVLMVSFMIDAVRYGKKNIRILSDDTDAFVILISGYGNWLSRLWCRWRMGWNIDNIVAALGDRSIQLLGVHAVKGCDTVSYPFNKGKLTTLCKLRE